MNTRKVLRERLKQKEILMLPGVYDALTAKIALSVGFDALVMGGYGVAASRLGEPDVGYLSMTEMAEALKTIKFNCNVKSIIIIELFALSDQYHILNLNHVALY